MSITVCPHCNEVNGNHKFNCSSQFPALPPKPSEAELWKDGSENRTYLEACIFTALATAIESDSEKSNVAQTTADFILEKYSLSLRSEHFKEPELEPYAPIEIIKHTIAMAHQRAILVYGPNSHQYKAFLTGYETAIRAAHSNPTPYGFATFMAWQTEKIEREHAQNLLTEHPVSDAIEFAEQDVINFIMEAYMEGFSQNGRPLGEWGDNLKENEQNLEEYINAKLLQHKNKAQ